MNDLRAQLAPGWSAVNIGLTVVLFLVAWPLALLMAAYVIWGGKLGLDFSRPETLRAFGGRIGQAWRAGTDSWRGGSTLSNSGGTGMPHAGKPDWPSASGTPTSEAAVGASATDETLRRERETLARDRQAFDDEKREWQQSADRKPREPLDS